MAVRSYNSGPQQPMEYVDFGSPRRPGRPRLYWLVHRGRRAAFGSTRRPVRPPVSVTELGHRLLGIKAGWELFGLSADSVVAIEFAQGPV